MENIIIKKACLICNGELKKRRSNWSFYCVRCNYWAAILATDITSENDSIFNAADDGEDVLAFLDDVRLENFNKILDAIDYEKTNKNHKALKILDIGCATGLFLKVAAQRGYEAEGIEPNPFMAKKATEKGCIVANGYFPSVLVSGNKFDVIIFNDVFEHIDNIKEIVAGCIEFLNPEGMLIVNAPTSDGFLFNLAQLLAIFGIKSPWNRLWQIMFYTPHLHYFNNYSLTKFLNKYNFAHVFTAELETIRLKNLWKRLRVDSTNTFLKSIAVFASLLTIYPIIKIFKKDTFFSIYRTGVSNEC